MVTDMSEVYVFTRQFYFILCLLFPFLLFVPCLYCHGLSLKGEIHEPRLSWREDRMGVYFSTNILPGDSRQGLVISSLTLFCFHLRLYWDDNG